MDKENVVHIPSAATSRRALPTARTYHETPHKSHTCTTTTTTTTTITTTPTSQQCLKQTTPPGTSKLLREHFSQLALSQRKRRILESGAVRILPTTPTTTPPPPSVPGSMPSVLASSTSSLITGSNRSRRRIGIDGTHQTPSKELLKPTACFRSYAVVEPKVVLQANSSRSSSSSSSPASFTTDKTTETLCYIPSPSSTAYERSSPFRRMGCQDPVAWTLLRGGEEDLPYLVEQDKTPNYQPHHPHAMSPPPTTANTTSAATFLPPMSANLHRVHGDWEHLARPVPRLAAVRRF